MSYHNVADNHNFDLLLKRSRKELKRIIEKYDYLKGERVSISFDGIDRFLQVQDLLNKFAVVKDLTYMDNITSIYKLNPDAHGALTIHIKPNGFFGWDYQDRRTVQDCEKFLIDNFILNPNFATHQDQDGYFWKPDVFTNNWYCFLKNGWREVELEKHLDLNLL